MRGAFAVIKVAIHIFGAREEGATIPSMVVERDLWLTPRKVQSRIGGLAQLEPLEHVAPGSRGHRAFIRHDNSGYFVELRFDGEADIECAILCKATDEWMSAPISLDVAKSLFTAIEAGSDPLSFLKECSIEMTALPRWS